jgi:diguanylate cyclase (GGDEF)-like protein
VTVSVGVATSPADGTTPRELVAAADEALYQAKRDGKDRVVAAAVPARVG